MVTIVDIIISSGISVVTAVAVGAFLGKKLVEAGVQRSFESFKTELTAKTETLKAQLLVVAHEETLVASRVDEQRATAISNIYAAICNVSKPLSKLASGSPIKNATPEMHLKFYEEVAEAAHKASGVLMDVLVGNAIYVTNDSYGTISDYTFESSQAIANLLSPIRAGQAKGVPADSILADVEKQRNEIEKLYQGTLLSLAQNVTREFRSILGVET